MKTLKDLCTPRKSVFDRTRRDVVLDLTDVLERKSTIKPDEFFQENYVTEGMRTLLTEAFKRLSGKTDQGVFVLTQAMGGGKTHNMIALGLLAKHPELRVKALPELAAFSKVGDVRVVGFTGRESDAPLGLWGAIADQLGKKEALKDYYSPLAAPGQTAWINLLKGPPTLILLDELPPYFQVARSKPIGNSDLAEVTTNALANLLVAVGKDDLRNVCIVISDLKSSYAEGSQQVNKALQNCEDEIKRSARRLEPVALNSNEIYHILRTRIFEKLPSDEDILAVARGYADSVKTAKQMDITNASPEQFAQNIKESYPFHFAIRDLYARFRENPGYQQTRALIRLMRVLVARIFDPKSGSSNRLHLIHAHDLDLNDADTYSEVASINGSLQNAISHDIASKGTSIAESMDEGTKTTDAQDVSKLLLVASLANIPSATLGLSLGEAVSFLCTPGRDVSKLKEVVSNLSIRAWYLHTSKDGKLYFKNVQNLVAKLRSAADNYNRETSLKELRGVLQNLFAPRLKDSYQEVLALPAVDEIKLKGEKTTLVISEPYQGGGLNPDLKKFYDDAEHKNRVMFLSGAHRTLDTLLNNAAELKAINWILEEMDAEKVSDNDPQRIAAKQMLDKIQLSLLSAARETFTALHFPNIMGLTPADFNMNFSSNAYDGEQQVRELLKSKQKFTEDIASDAFRKQLESKLFTAKTMEWAEIRRRAACTPSWPWHRPDALDALKTDLVRKDQWREQGNFIEKSPFPKPDTRVTIQELSRNDDTGEAVLKLTAIHGDSIVYEVGAGVTPGSAKVSDPRQFKTRELSLSFLCLDSTKEHATGEKLVWKNRITLKAREYQDGKSKMVQLQAAPDAPIKYTTDGTHPSQGATYTDPFPVPKKTVVVLAEAEKNGVVSERFEHRINWDQKGGVVVDPAKAAAWKRLIDLKTTKETYEFLARLEKRKARAGGVRVTVSGVRWAEMSFDPALRLDKKQLEEAIDHLRRLLQEGEVRLEAGELAFERGQDLLDWVVDVKTELREGEVEQ